MPLHGKHIVRIPHNGIRARANGRPYLHVRKITNVTKYIWCIALKTKYESAVQFQAHTRRPRRPPKTEWPLAGARWFWTNRTGRKCANRIRVLAVFYYLLGAGGHTHYTAHTAHNYDKCQPERALTRTHTNTQLQSERIETGAFRANWYELIFVWISFVQYTWLAILLLLLNTDAVVLL